MAVALVVQALLSWKGGYAIFFGGRAAITVFASFFGLIWAISFLLAFRIVFPSVWATIVG
jgi:hypothetical protein